MAASNYHLNLRMKDSLSTSIKATVWGKKPISKKHPSSPRCGLKGLQEAKHESSIPISITVIPLSWTLRLAFNKHKGNRIRQEFGFASQQKQVHIHHKKINMYMSIFSTIKIYTLRMHLKNGAAALQNKSRSAVGIHCQFCLFADTFPTDPTQKYFRTLKNTQLTHWMNQFLMCPRNGSKYWRCQQKKKNSKNQSLDAMHSNMHDGFVVIESSGCELATGQVFFSWIGWSSLCLD